MPRKEEIETEIRGFDDAYSDVEQACRAAIEWADKTMIEKACQVLNNMLVEVTYFDKDSIAEHYDKYEFIEDFKKAMEE